MNYNARYQPMQSSVEELYRASSELNGYAQRLDAVKTRLGLFPTLMGYRGSIGHRSSAVGAAAAAAMKSGQGLDTIRMGYMIGEQSAYQLLSGDRSFNVGDGVTPVNIPFGAMFVPLPWWRIFRDFVFPGGAVVGPALRILQWPVVPWWLFEYIRKHIKDLDWQQREQGTSGRDVLEQYDGTGSYGGNQGSPAQNWEAMAEIVRRYYPNMTDKQIKEYLNTLNHNGCAYTALTNTIFTAFRGRPEDFERTFGFPMYGKNGDLNYDAMIVDFYASTGKGQDKPWYLFWMFWEDNDEYASKHGAGLTNAEMERYWEGYLREHGVGVDVSRNLSVTKDNFESLSRNGEIILTMRPLSMYANPDKSGYHDTRNGGHAVVVTGVTDDGLFIVSSWGDTYYVDPVADAGKFSYMQVKY